LDETGRAGPLRLAVDHGVKLATLGADVELSVYSLDVGRARDHLSAAVSTASGPAGRRAK
jgi:hypothetical protein